MPDKGLLSRFGFFSDLNPNTIEAIAQRCKSEEFEPGEVIYQIEEPAEHLYGLVEGVVELSLVFKDKVLKTDIEYEEAIQASMVDEEKQIVVEVVRPGQVFGWAALVGDGRRTVTARCVEASKTFSVLAEELRALFERDHYCGYTLMKKMGDMLYKHLKNRTDKLIDTWTTAFDVDEM